MVILTDNSAEDRNLMVEIIDQLDRAIRVLTMSSGSLLLKYLFQCTNLHIISLIILDMKIPVLDVPQVIQRIRSDRRYDRIAKQILLYWKRLDPPPAGKKRF